MHKLSFAVGLIVGGTAAIGAVIAVPGLLPRDGKAAQERAPRIVPKIIEVPVPAAPPHIAHTPDAVEPAVSEKRDSDAEEMRKEADALAALMLKAKMRSNETAAIATLRNITSAQSQFQSSARADENQNGVGEYGSFGELSGEKGVREGEALNPPVLSSVFRRVKEGRVKRSGYYFRIFLVRADGEGVHEQPEGGFRAFEVDPRLSETNWCAYAWPVERGVTGERCFFVNQAGDILANSDRKYAGEDEPQADAAFEPGTRGILGKAAIGGAGNDRGEWKQSG